MSVKELMVSEEGEIFVNVYGDVSEYVEKNKGWLCGGFFGEELFEVVEEVDDCGEYLSELYEWSEEEKKKFDGCKEMVNSVKEGVMVKFSVEYDVNWLLMNEESLKKLKESLK